MMFTLLHWCMNHNSNIIGCMSAPLQSKLVPWGVTYDDDLSCVSFHLITFVSKPSSPRYYLLFQSRSVVGAHIQLVTRCILNWIHSLSQWMVYRWTSWRKLTWRVFIINIVTVRFEVSTLASRRGAYDQTSCRKLTLLLTHSFQLSHGANCLAQHDGFSLYFWLDLATNGGGRSDLRVTLKTLALHMSSENTRYFPGQPLK